MCYDGGGLTTTAPWTGDDASGCGLGRKRRRWIWRNCDETPRWKTPPAPEVTSVGAMDLHKFPS